MDFCYHESPFLGAVPAVIHTGRFFVLIPLKGLEKLMGVKDKYI
jgi:predicted PhzF superfamily epimerase YddE/YHI9